MRSVLSVDLFCAGRAVCAARPEDQLAVARVLVRRALFADRYRARHGCPHPEWGDGTLAAAARHHGPLAEGSACDPALAEALICVLRALIDRAQAD